ETGPTSDLAALVSTEALDLAEQRVREAVAQGARILVGGGRLEGTTAPVMCPTLLTDVTPAMAIMREETFAPVFSVVPVRDDAEAVRLANATPYGLTASVWTRNRTRGWGIARQLAVGSVALNDHVWPFYAPESPWGGVKGSGTGRTGGSLGLLALTYPKMVSEERIGLPREFYWKPFATWLYPLYCQALPLLFSRRPRVRLRAFGKLLGMLFNRGQ
ncbi:MAG: aldehyde dehydrogenase family protein, partial [Chloroflexia bacterium]|nr:aldehyde dehydrogenase family protein [Chloroflexia bacterium]